MAIIFIQAVDIVCPFLFPLSLSLFCSFFLSFMGGQDLTRFREFGISIQVPSLSQSHVDISQGRVETHSSFCCELSVLSILWCECYLCVQLPFYIILGGGYWCWDTWPGTLAWYENQNIDASLDQSSSPCWDIGALHSPPSTFTFGAKLFKAPWLTPIIHCELDIAGAPTHAGLEIWGDVHKFFCWALSLKYCAPIISVYLCKKKQNWCVRLF